MHMIQACHLPDDALLHKYRDQGAYTDSYVIDVAWPVSRSEYVEAFYTTAVFKLERLLLSWLGSMPSTDMEARQLAVGARSEFAAWRVEAQTPDQLLMCDISGRTRSWMMVAPIENAGLSEGTRLYFGSAIVRVVNKRSGTATLGFTYRSLLGFHKLYSRVLLHATKSHLSRHRAEAP